MRIFPLLALLTLLAACAGKEGVLTLEPAFVDFGEVNFHDTMPLEGFDQRDIDLVNTGLDQLNVRIPGFDRVHLCLEGFDTTDGIIELPGLSPDSRYVLKLSVCGYDLEAAELGTTFEGRIHLVNDGADPVEMLEYTFTPVRDQGGDTGE